jgi:hypothetical protein
MVWVNCCSTCQVPPEELRKPLGDSYHVDEHVLSYNNEDCRKLTSSWASDTQECCSRWPSLVCFLGGGGGGGTAFLPISISRVRPNLPHDGVH